MWDGVEVVVTPHAVDRFRERVDPAGGEAEVAALCRASEPVGPLVRAQARVHGLLAFRGTEECRAGGVVLVVRPLGRRVAKVVTVIAGGEG